MKNRIEVEVPKEILDYEAKVMWGLSLRQFISVLVMLFTVVPIFLIFIFLLETDGHLLNILIMLVSVPSLGWGFIKKDGLSFEKLLATKWQSHTKPNIKKWQNYEVRKNDTTGKNSKQDQKIKDKEGEAYIYEISEKKIKKTARKSIKRAKKERRNAGKR